MDYKELEQAMADLDEDTVLDMMKEVMVIMEKVSKKHWKHARKEWLQ